MAIVGGFDIHRRQVTFDYLDTETGKVFVACVESLQREPVTETGPGEVRLGERGRLAPWPVVITSASVTPAMKDEVAAVAAGPRADRCGGPPGWSPRDLPGQDSRPSEGRYGLGTLP